MDISSPADLLACDETAEEGLCLYWTEEQNLCFDEEKKTSERALY